VNEEAFSGVNSEQKTVAYVSIRIRERPKNALLLVLVSWQAYHVALGTEILPKDLYLASDLANFHLKGSRNYNSG
jgi:hypothetical protein